jgi:ribosomal protein S20
MMADYLALARRAQARYRAEQEAARLGPVADYRGALRTFWRLTAAAGDETDRAEAVSAYNVVIKLIDEIGEPLATTLRHRFEVQWFEETGCCPRCGVRGTTHV